MSYEFHAHLPYALQDGTVQAFALQWLAGETQELPKRWGDLRLLRDPTARLTVLAQAMITPQLERARSGTRTQAGGYRLWVERDAAAFLARQRTTMQQLGLEPTLPDLATLPPGAWALRLTFTLSKPYLSRDDRLFHLLENPVKKEWVFDVPYIAPSGWKGALRAALRQMRGYTTLEQEANDSQMVRLFGNVRGDEEAFHAGSVQFFPTFFNRLGLEVINPHDRKTGAGARGPILLECVPAGAQGALMLLYVPTGIAVDMQQSAADLVVVAQGIQAMLSTYGFGAKTSSGFGIAADDLVDGEIRIMTKTLSLKGKRLSDLAVEVEHWLKTTP